MLENGRSSSLYKIINHYVAYVPANNFQGTYVRNKDITAHEKMCIAKRAIGELLVYRDVRRSSPCVCMCMCLLDRKLYWNDICY